MTRINQIETWMPEAMRYYQPPGGAAAGSRTLQTGHWAVAPGHVNASCPNAPTSTPFFLIGSGPIVIGQACEFDYSGTQACKALKEEGYRVILINSNPATIMTDPELADRTYVEPITLDVVEKVIERERPDALLPTMGGQTALNATIGLVEAGVLEKYGVNLIGASADAIHKAEDRDAFKQAMQRIGFGCRRAGRPTAVRKPLVCSTVWAFRRSSGRRLPWAGRAATSPTIVKNSKNCRVGPWP